MFSISWYQSLNGFCSLLLMRRQPGREEWALWKDRHLPTKGGKDWYTHHTPPDQMDSCNLPSRLFFFPRLGQRSYNNSMP